MKFATEIYLPPLPKLYHKRLFDYFYAQPEYDDYVRGINIKHLDDDVLAWLKNNIGEGQWVWQSFHKDLDIHVDKTTTTLRLMYFIDRGGEAVQTHFHDLQDKIIETHVYPKDTWILMRTDIPHSVVGLEPGRRRMVVTMPFIALHGDKPHLRENL